MALRWAQTAEIQARPDTVALYGRFLAHTHGITLRIRELPRGDLCSLPSTAGNCRRTVFDSDDASTCSPDANVTSNITSRFGPRLAKVSTDRSREIKRHIRELCWFHLRTADVCSMNAVKFV